MHLTRFLTQPLPRTPRFYEKHVAAHAAVPIDPHGTEEKAIGWCQHGDDLNLRPDYVHGAQILMDMRIETMKAPAKELKRLLRIRVAELEKETGAPVSKSKVRELKEVIARDLRQKVPSKMSSVPFLWDLDRKKLWLYSQSSGALESFLLLFSKTFDVGIDTPKLPDEQFLTWLLYRAALNADFGGFTAVIGPKILLSSGEASITVDGDIDAARRAIAENYSVRELPIEFTVGTKTYAATLTRSGHPKAVSLPSILDDTAEALETAQLLDDLDRFVNMAYSIFVEQGEAVKPLIRRWAGQD